jgi:SAM-dependent methyltransferase
MAADYDSEFTRSVIGAEMRRAVQRRMDACFRPGDRILEVNCGTGEDALYLARREMRVVATDISPAMAEVARSRAEAAGLSTRIEVKTLAVEALELRAVSPDAQPFDGILSNFGGLNCVTDLKDAAVRAAACVRPGGVALLCVMGPLCPWEWAWYLLGGSPRKAFRRLRPGGVPWRGLTIRYPSIRRMRAALAPHFRFARVRAVGALLPPTYAESWAKRHPRLTARLSAWERRIAAWPLMPCLADHYLLEMVRVNGEADD